MRNITAGLAAAVMAGALALAASPAAYAEETEPSDAVVAPIAVTPTGVELVDECGTANDGFFFPDEQEGVVTYDIEGAFGEGYTVTAVLAEGYVLAEGATGIWEYPALTDSPCDDAGTPTDPSEPSTPAEPADAAPAAEVSEPTDASSSALAETGFDGGIVAGIAAGAVLLGGALVGGTAFARRRAAE
jgi:hypothetical protein